MKKKMKKNGIDRGCILLSALYFIFYIVQWASDGYYLSPDTASYMDMEPGRPWAYPLFLRFFVNFRDYNSPELYRMAAFVQCLLAALCLSFLLYALHRSFSLRGISLYITGVILLAPDILNRFFAGRRVTYAVSIISEGLSIYLWMLFLGALILYMSTGKNRFIVLSSAVALILLGVRLQLVICLPLLVFACWWRKLMTGKRRVLDYIKPIILAGCLFLTYSAIGNTLNVIRYGSADDMGLSNAFLTFAIYSAPLDYQELMPKDDEGLVLKDIIDDIVGRGYHVSSAPEKGILEQVAHLAHSYDEISIFTLNRKITDHLLEKGVTDLMEIRHRMSAFNRRSLKILLPYSFGSMLRLWILSFGTGVIQSLSVDRPGFFTLGMIIFVIYLVLLVLVYRQEALSAEVGSAIMILGSLIINSAVVSLTFFIQTRYTIYNLAPFYFSLLILLKTWRPTSVFLGDGDKL